MTSITKLTLGVVVALLVLSVAIVGYVTPFMLAHQTRITNDEMDHTH